MKFVMKFVIQADTSETVAAFARLGEAATPRRALRPSRFPRRPIARPPEAA